LQALLSENGGWFTNVPLGEVWVVPKKRRSVSASPNEVIRIGSGSSGHQDAGLDVQLRLTPTPEFAIVEVLFLWRFGPALDSLLSRNALGYRLDLRDGRFKRTRRWLFEYWPKRYQEFRTAPLAAAREELRRANSAVIILSADLASFYDTIDPSFLLQDNFVRQVVGQLEAMRSDIDIDEYRTATRSLLSSDQWFQRIAARRTGLDWHTGVPIGALTSRLIANVSLATLDRAIAAQPDVICYRRYVDDFVIVSRTSPNDRAGFDDTLSRYLPYASETDGTLKLDVGLLERPGSEFQLQRAKIRLHHLNGIQGEDFLSAIKADFRHLVSERRAFLDSSVLLEDVATQLVRAGAGKGTPLRVLRDADRAKLEQFALSTTLRSLERVSVLVDLESARGLARQTLETIGRFLAGEEDWVENLELAFRLLRLGIDTQDWRESHQLSDWMDKMWGTVDQLKNSVGTLYHRDRQVSSSISWVWLRNYLHARRLDAICGALRPTARRSILPHWLQRGIPVRTRVLRGQALIKQARLLAAADLRARDREDDNFRLNPYDSKNTDESLHELDSELKARMNTIRRFVDRCADLGDLPWQVAPVTLFLCTRPPSYFDIARRWLYRAESDGFGPDVFHELLDVVNAVRGTAYQDPVGQVLSANTVAIPGNIGDRGVEIGDDVNPRLILGNLVVPETAFRSAATRKPHSPFWRPSLTAERLKGLAHVLAHAARASREPSTLGKTPASLLVLPELSIPRAWFRTVANHVARSGDFGLVAGLEYLHDASRPLVRNQVYAVLPGPYSSVATWPWTKRLPAREEAEELAKLRPKVSFPQPHRPDRPRTVVNSLYGRFSILICSEMIETRRTADLLGRVELILAPSWNRDTASYDHLIQSVGLQLHAIIAVANNGQYSDCRAWAPRSVRWQRDLCRLVEREVDNIVFIDIPLDSLLSFHLHAAVTRSNPSPITQRISPAEWCPLPPDWP
jgi:hypothetical protein